jgi:hypothetical protein
MQTKKKNYTKFTFKVNRFSQRPARLSSIRGMRRGRAKKRDGPEAAPSIFSLLQIE